MRSILRSCRVCRRHEGGPYPKPPLSALPKERVAESPPFTRTGLDYLGPLYVKTAEGTEKTWVCLFTCMVVRAIHLELMQDMTTEEFLLGLRRFVSQRGVPALILSDNASQFKAASNFLGDVWNQIQKSDDVQSYASNSGITWRFIVELAPWMGGFYERLIGLVKRALKKSIGRRKLTIVQLQTLLKEVEAVINSRPLVYVGDDVNSSLSLTPGHFLSLNPNTGIPTSESDDDEDYTCKTTSNHLLKVWKKGQKLLDQFWKSWRDDYLASIRERMQYSLRSPRILSPFQAKIGDVVLIKDNVPRGCWKTGRIRELVVSRDGYARSVKICLSSGKVLGRTLNLIYPLECSTPEELNCDRPIMDGPSEINVRPVRKAAEKAKEKFKKQL